MPRASQVWQWLDAREGSALTWKGADGYFVALSDPAKSATPGRAARLAAIPFAEGDFATIESELKRHFGRAAGLEFRLLGPNAERSPWIKVLEAKGLKSVKPVSLAWPLELQYWPSEHRIRREKAKAAGPTPAEAPRPRVLASAAPPAKTRVLVVDDSSTIRQILTMVLSQDPAIEVVASVERPSLVEEHIARLKPDVITLDIHMPEMDGVTLLKRILPKFRIPTIMISSLSLEEGGLVLDALEAGAVDYIQKPSLQQIEEVGGLIREKVRSAHTAKVASPPAARPAPAKVAAGVSVFAQSVDTDYLVAIGSSTGGTEALREVLVRLPSTIPPIVVVQHIPAVFSRALANRLDSLCPFDVKEAQDGDVVRPNLVLIAPGGLQMSLVARGDQRVVRISDAPPMNRHKPSVDFLFDSIEKLRPKKLIAGILTGMGADGARGLLALKGVGAKTFAQDEATSIVYGMPREAARLGAADSILPLDQIGGHIIARAQRPRRSAA